LWGGGDKKCRVEALFNNFVSVLYINFFIFYIIGLEGMLEEEVDGLEVGFEIGFWAKPFSGMEIFDEDRRW